MHGEIITIGNELTSGRTPDLNAHYVAGKLTASGLNVIRITSVGDDERMAAEALKRALASSRFVIITGGLGSTEDDMTSKIVATALDRPLCLDHRMLRKIRNYVAAHGIEMTPPLEKMAFMPKGATMIHPKGAVCGFSLIERDIRFYCLPGVPEEMRHVLDAFVLPELLSLYESPPVMRQRLLKLYGVDESQIAEILSELMRTSGEVAFGFYPHFPENHITISLRGDDAPSVTAALDKVEQDIMALVGPYVFATGDQEMEEVVGRLLRHHKKTLSVAESCTGGLIGHRLTDVAGSSEYFQGGVVSYSNQSKTDILHVNWKTLERHGAVSSQTAEEMARGIRKQMKSDLGLAVTGIAGPEGGTREKPVGTVYIGLDAFDGTVSRRYRFRGRRKQVKLNTSMMALDWVRRRINGDPLLPGI
ncbi:MAG: competence/damage-inducible protein A [Deltaproteobacteria bacterium]|nr:competence/damage-inducible protein A [Deltaproteobacteria bacterium]